ncbi:hypothetical protein CFP56_033683 [Quercus suber]|uniref:Uncharacterized protein n=1 Tax=Quercus suber TaxID=58331 RepID=A0AAW0JFW3_QUESU
MHQVFEAFAGQWVIKVYSDIAFVASYGFDIRFGFTIGFGTHFSHARLTGMAHSSSVENATTKRS